MDKKLEMNIDMELKEAIRGVRSAEWEAVYSAARSAARSARSATRESSRSARSSAYSAVGSVKSYNEERLNQLEMIKEVL